MNVANPALQSEQILGGRYRVKSLLGRGGMGVVYRVEEVLLNRELALKTIDKSAISDNAIRRFQAEARIAFGINHPNIISVYDFGLLEDSTPFMAMELVSGTSLSDFLKTRTMTVEEAIPMFMQVCHGLAHAHSNGVIHRDIKPSNIMLVGGTGGTVKVLDFGIAKLTQLDSGEAQALTRTGEIFGSPLYMSPEQCTGTPADHRTDIYSLGCVMFETLSGTPPFVGENALSTMMMHQNAEAPTLREASLGKQFPAELETLIQKMLSKDPKDRYQNLTKVAQELASLANGQTTNTQASRLTQNSSSIRKAVQPKQIQNTVELSKPIFVASILFAAIVSSALTAGAFALLGIKHPAVDAKENVEPAISQAQGMLHDLAVHPKELKTARQPERSFSLTFSKEALKELSEDNDVQDLAFDNCSISNADLKQLTHLKLLDICIKQCDVQNLDEITKIKTLTRIELENMQSPGRDIDIERCASMPNLRQLNLRHSIFPESALRKLAKSNTLVWVDLPKGPNGPYSDKFLNELHVSMPQCGFSPAEQRRINSVISDKCQPFIKDPEKQCIVSIDTAKHVNPNLSIIPKSLVTLAIVALQKHEIERARRHIEEALNRLNRIGLDAEKIEALTVAGNVYREAGDEKAEARARNEALKIGEIMLMHDSPEYQDVILSALTIPIRNKNLAEIKRLCDFGIESGKKYTRSSMKKVGDFYEIAGWQSYLLGDKAGARKYFEDEVEYLRPGKKNYPEALARAQASVARGVESPDQVQNLKEVISQVEQMRIPRVADLDMNYYDCCFALSSLLATNPATFDESMLFLRKPLNHLRTVVPNPVRDLRYNAYRNVLVKRLEAAKKTAEAKQAAEEFPLRSEKTNATK